jgi:hypothetical protein
MAALSTTHMVEAENWIQVLVIRDRYFLIHAEADWYSSTQQKLHRI